MNYKVLIIDDDKELSSLLQSCLHKKNIYADLAHTGAKGLSMLKEYHDYQAIILDIMLPDIDGFTVLSEIRAAGTIPVCMLTAKNEDNDKVKGLSMGADDYLTKPFSINEFLARVDSMIRRYTIFNQESNSVYLEFQNLKLDVTRRQVFVADEPVSLTSKEFDLLYFLASNENAVFTKRQIYRQVWQEEYEFDDGNIMSFISKLRKKLGDGKYIQTVHGVGYRFTGKV